MEDLVGRSLGPYEIVARLGAGNMASVYQAVQAGSDRRIALKVLPQHLAEDPIFAGRFHQEAAVIANLRHPHILPLIDFGEANGYTYIAMPLAEKGALAHYLNGSPLSLDQICGVALQLASALDYAHSRGVVHRDVKPSNVLIDGSGNCQLADFGMAKILAGTAKFTAAGLAVGTPAYMSPEQALATRIDGRSDIYSLGVVLYQMSTGRVPFQAKTPIAVVHMHLSEPAPPPRTLNPALPAALEQVILKALAKQPDDRYASAVDMARAVQEATAAGGV